VFVTWIGDHAPRHVHVYKDEEEVLKWNLDASVAIQGRANRRIARLIVQPVEEGRL
jgi:hypothetical protein